VTGHRGHCREKRPPGHPATGLRQPPRPAGRAGRRRKPPHDQGVATVWAAAGVAVIMAALLVGVHLGAAVIARHRAEAAADLAALAAAGIAVEGAGPACRKAAEIAAAMDGTVTTCRLVAWDALVEVQVPIAVALPGTSHAAGRARAGPDPSAARPPPVPPAVRTAPPDVSPRSRPAGRRPGRVLRSRATSGRPRQVGGSPGRIRWPFDFPAVRPTTRRITGTLVVASVPMSDAPWQRREQRGLLEVATRQARPAGPGSAPRTAVGPAR
jgi:secretion/DNA translocation related TadE-like protein